MTDRAVIQWSNMAKVKPPPHIDSTPMAPCPSDGRPCPYSCQGEEVCTTAEPDAEDSNDERSSSGEPDAGDVETVLRQHGLSDDPSQFDSNIHSWRCEYPDRYGPCSCFQDLVADLAEVARTAVEEALREVEVLHAPVRMYPELRFAPWCGECSQGFTAGGDDAPSQRRVSWPCPTAKAAGMTDPLAREEGAR